MWYRRHRYGDDEYYYYYYYYLLLLLPLVRVLCGCTFNVLCYCMH